MKNELLLLFLQLNLVFGTVNKCGYNLLQQCYCGLQFHDNRSMFVVECAGLGFTNTDMLRELPDETEMLIFTGNHVGTLPSNVFGENRNMTNLRIIDMSNNGIQDIKGKAFHHVIGVTRLILNHNNISISAQYDKNFHHPRVFSNFINLEELHLTNAFADNTGAALADDLHDIFVNSNLTKLYKIHLEQNEIKNFKDDRVFCDLPNIHDIYLGNNNIPSLNFNITCLPKLRYLDLEKNNITKFSYQDLENFDKLAYPYRTTQNLTLDIDGNPFRCDQAINNLYNWLHKTNVKVRDLEMLQCHQIKYGTEYIMNLKILAESKNAKISQALTVLLIVLVFILLTLLSAYAYLKKDSVKSSLSPIFESVTRKVQYNKIESQDVYV
ncbi:phospholipase A2 inhibitor [Diorhabda carinulata]|uniref:phospholipase A2 inhibitor n=1 Tax=Diorhabda sublineata TaxID=1163346 RepID=UPI0024E187C1|nr:phospholipase A2 inhibitor [Diorhabda sublineata]XP_057669801.1 phospholipase A2 inhibitor [Diorhabda carinulata]XP_057669802.1 phospholipase A2 inhibitor [Diorhabda carinulata]